MSLELMAPVKNQEGLAEALNAGADSVYFGLKEFNARSMMENFTVEEAEKAIEYVHSQGKKAYLTLNTLIKNDEIPVAAEYARKAVNAGIDAIIVQDLGLFSLLRKCNVPLIASTQMTVCNSRGVRVAKEMGFKRVVLSRELNVNELRSVASKSKGIELECFIHGGLCIGYSGQCGVSCIFEKAAANRGICRTPCWDDYTLYCNDAPIKSGKLIKPKDMYGIHHIPVLDKAGISALKIQGRTRSAEYVRNVVSVYRKHLDDLRKLGSTELTSNELDILHMQSPRGLMQGNLEVCANRNFVVEGQCDIISKEEFRDSTEAAVCEMPNKISVMFNDLASVDADRLTGDIARIYIPMKMLVSRYVSVISALKRVAPVYMVMPMLMERYDMSCEELEALIKEYGINGISLSNLGDLAYVNEIDCDFSVERSFNVCNRYSADLLKKWGISSISLPFELTSEEAIALSDKSDVSFERTVYGRPMLMQMKYCLISNTNECIEGCSKCQSEDEIYTLAGKNTFMTQTDPARTETTLRAVRKLALPILHNEAELVRLEFTDEDTDQINWVLQMYSSGRYPVGNYITSTGSV